MNINVCWTALYILSERFQCDQDKLKAKIKLLNVIKPHLIINWRKSALSSIYQIGL